MVRLSKNQLNLISVSLPLPNGLKVVLLDIGGRRDISLVEHNSNIYCIDGLGDVRWQIQAGATIQERDSFVSISASEDGLLYADRFFGNEFIVNPENGLATHVGWHK